MGARDTLEPKVKLTSRYRLIAYALHAARTTHAVAWDVVLCPPMPTPVFPHDHTPEGKDRHIDIDGKSYPYLDQIVWPAVATLVGLPATAAPIGLSPAGLPIGVQIIGPYLEDRTPLRFAELIERAFGALLRRRGLRHEVKSNWRCFLHAR
jgi:Asp-tRNA(Asn)/Glu-tRNA(Gln) amidotransferase A subunit family amidase